MDGDCTLHIRQAMASEDWQRASVLWDQYVDAVRQEISNGTCSGERMREAREFLDWARCIVLCVRAQAQERLRALHVAQRYDPAPAVPASFLRASL